MEELEKIWDGVRGLLAHKDCQALVLEIADGILQPETKLISSSKSIMGACSVLILAADGSLSAFGAIEFLSRRFHRKPDFLSGMIINSNMALREITNHIDIPVLNDMKTSRKSFMDHISRVTNSEFDYKDSQG